MSRSVVQLMTSPRDNDFNIFSVTLAMPTEESAIQVFQELGVIPLVANCPTCTLVGNPQLLQVKREGENHGRLGFRWICSVCRARAESWRFSPLKNTIFENRRLDYLTTFRIMHFWFDQMKVSKAAFHCQVTDETAINLYSLLRNICLTNIKHNSFLIGGNGDIVEVDETHLFTRKYRRGRLLKRQMWVFGGMCRRTSQIFVQLIENKRKETLWPIMQECIAQDTFIMSDEHLSYVGCPRLGFKGHAAVCHKRNFVRPHPVVIVDLHPELAGDDLGPGPTPGLVNKSVKVHTNKLERLWREAKKHVCTVENVDMLPAYIGEFVYRHNILRTLPTKGQQFRRFIDDLINILDLDSMELMRTLYCVNALSALHEHNFFNYFQVSLVLINL